MEKYLPASCTGRSTESDRRDAHQLLFASPSGLCQKTGDRSELHLVHGGRNFFLISGGYCTVTVLGSKGEFGKTESFVF